MARVSDLFPEYEDYRWLQGECNLKEKFGKRNNCVLARSIFHTFMNLVMDDVVEGHCFRFPAYSAMLYIEQIPDEAAERLREVGKLQGFREALVSVPYAPTYRFVSQNGGGHKFRVIFDKARYYRMLRKLNEGKRYSKNIGIW